MTFTWQETSPLAVVNPASAIFTGQLNEVGRTYPIFNGVQTYTGTPGGEVNRIANALNGPLIQRNGSRVRITGPGTNTVSALVHVPTNGPWNATVTVSSIRRFADGGTQSGAAIRSVVSSLPRSGTVLVRVTSNPQFVTNTAAHEQRHAEDIHQVCQNLFTLWYSAISVHSDEWFDSEAALDGALFRMVGLTDYSGDRRQRLARELVLRIGNGSNYLHDVVDRNSRFLIVNPRWNQSRLMLEFALQEEVAGPVAQHRRHQTRRVV